MRHVSLAVNGVRHELDLEPRELLVYVLRDRLGLTGTNVGCDTSSCGACTVLLNGESVKSCTLLGVQADGMELTTIEGLASNGDLHPLQQAFHEQHGLQCGYCTPGMVMAAASLLAENPEPSEAEIRHALEGNLCRCTGYQNIVAAVRAAAVRSGGVMATTETLTTGRVVGTPVPRKEDRKLVTGNGQFIDNINLPGQVWLAVVRSPYAHARIGKVDLAAARKVKGVVAAFSGAELAADWAGSLPCAWPVTEEIRMPSHFPLAFDKARHVGDGVAVVVAETRGDREGRGRARRGRVRAARGGRGRRQGARRRRTARARRLRDERVLRLEARRRRGRPGVRRGRRHRQAAVPPAAADPGGDGAARRPRPGAARHRRADAVDLDADPAHRAADARGRRRASRRRGCA